MKMHHPNCPKPLSQRLQVQLQLQITASLVSVERRECTGSYRVYADGMIYSFYGRLSVASTDSKKFAASNLPPTYFCYGGRDPFVDEFEECVEALHQAEVPVEVDVLEGRPHGYGYSGDWIPAYDEWLEHAYKNN